MRDSAGCRRICIASKSSAVAHDHDLAVGAVFGGRAPSGRTPGSAAAGGRCVPERKLLPTFRAPRESRPTSARIASPRLRAARATSSASIGGNGITCAVRQPCPNLTDQRGPERRAAFESATAGARAAPERPTVAIQSVGAGRSRAEHFASTVPTGAPRSSRRGTHLRATAATLDHRRHDRSGENAERASSRDPEKLGREEKRDDVSVRPRCWHEVSALKEEVPGDERGPIPMRRDLAR